MKRLANALSLLLCVTMLTACQTGSTVERIDTAIVQQLTIQNIGACQGVFVHDGSVWLYGDRGSKGVIKRLKWIGPNEDGQPMLKDAGETYELLLYRNRYSRSNDNEKLPPSPKPPPPRPTPPPHKETKKRHTRHNQGPKENNHKHGHPP